MTGRAVGKTSAITVAAQGIGHASALAMAREGINVIATDVNLGKLAALHGTRRECQLDVLDADANFAFAGTIPVADLVFYCPGMVTTNMSPAKPP